MYKNPLDYYWVTEFLHIEIKYVLYTIIRDFEKYVYYYANWTDILFE